MFIGAPLLNPCVEFIDFGAFDPKYRFLGIEFSS
jgi:hypothetical protein